MTIVRQAKPKSNIIPFQRPFGGMKSLGIPESEEAEQALIAALLYNPHIFHEVATTLDDDAWFYLKHQIIWQGMNELSNDGVSIDMVTLPRRLLETENTTMESALHFIGGPAYLTEIIRINFDSYRNYKAYVSIINEAHRRRCMLVASNELESAALDYEVEINESVNRAYGHLDKLNDKNRTFTTIGDGLRAHLDIAEERRQNPLAGGIPSGITKLELMIDGFHKRRVILVAGRPHHGKTALLMTIALYAASLGIRVGIFNTADGNEQDVTGRLIGIAGNVSSHEILMGRCDAEEYNRYFEAVGKVEKYPIYIESKKGMTLPELLVKARNMKYRYGLDMICIDYAQRIGIDLSHPKSPVNRADQLAYISGKITKLAGEKLLNLPILVGAQLNRGAEGRRPGMADVKGSGAFEEDADIMIMPYRENFSSDTMELIVCKNKVTGRTGTIDVSFNKVSTKIGDLQW